MTQCLIVATLWGSLQSLCDIKHRQTRRTKYLSLRNLSSVAVAFFVIYVLFLEQPSGCRALQIFNLKLKSSFKLESLNM